MKCDVLADIARPQEGSLDALETIRFLDLRCRQCGEVTKEHRICDLLIVKLAKLTTRSLPHTEQSENQLVIKGDELKDLISTLRPMVASTSFALGILYRELADVCEKLGRMDKCVEAYKLMIPIIE